MTEFSVENLRSGLDNLDVTLSSIDEEEIKERTLKRAANEMAEMVREAVIEEDDIVTPGMNSKYGRGKGPSLSTADAWDVDESGGQYIVRPDPRVRQRAITLNYGYPGTITPDGDSPMPIQINGTPIFRWEVDGPDYTGYWQAAMRRFEASDRIGEIGAEELQRQFEQRRY